MPSVELGDSAYSGIDRLRAEPTLLEMRRAVLEVLRDLARGDHREEHQRRRYSNGLWRTDVRDAFHDWMILWREKGEDVLVEYIGPIPGGA